MPKPTTFALQSGNALATGLLRAYGFGEGSGSTVRDYSGGGYDLTARTSLATASATWAVDPTFGAGVVLDGSTRDLRGVDTGLPPTGSRAWAFQVKVPVGASGYFLGYGTSAESLFAIGVSAGQLVFTTNGTQLPSTFTIADATFHTILVSYDSVAGLFTFYADGLNVGTGGYSSLTTGSSGSLYFGQAGGTGGSNSDGSQGLNCACTIAGAQAWSRALGPAENSSLQADFWQAVRASAPAFPPPLIPYLGRRRAG